MHYETVVLKPGLLGLIALCLDTMRRLVELIGNYHF